MVILFPPVDRRLKSVCQFTKDGKFVENYKSITEASQYTGISYSGIGNCCRGTQKTSGGHIWRYGNYDAETNQINQ